MAKKKQLRRNRIGLSRHGLTLVEMLIGLSIAALLSLLLIPAAGRTLEAGRLAKCLGNLRALGGAMHVYAAENSGILPSDQIPRDPAVPTANFITWMEVIAPYMHLDWKKISKLEAVRNTPFVCPSERQHTQLPYLSYAMNRDMNFRMFGEKGRIRLSNLSNASSYAVLCDSFNSSIIYSDSTSHLEEWTQVSRRHGGFPNVLFADGHAEPVRQKIYGYDKAEGRTEFFMKFFYANGTLPAHR